MSSKFSGKIQRSDLEGGFWLLKTSSGNTYQVEGLPQEFQQVGIDVEAEGTDEGSGFGIGFGMPTLRISSIRKK